MNYINIVIIIIFLIYIYRGYTDGGVRIFTGFLGLIVAYAISVKYYTLGGYILEDILKIPLGFNKFIFIVVTFIIIAVAFEILSNIAYKRIPKEFRSSPLNRYLGVILSFIEALILLSFIIFIIENINFFPGQGSLQSAIRQSSIGSYIIKENNKILSPIVGNAIQKIQTKKSIIIPSKWKRPKQKIL